MVNKDIEGPSGGQNGGDYLKKGSLPIRTRWSIMHKRVIVMIAIIQREAENSEL